MAEQKRYYWLKLDKDFFRSKRIKKLRRLAGGDTFTIIYLKMQLLSLTTNGCLEYTGLENSFEEELSLDIDEDVENIKITVSYLLKCGLLIENDNCEYSMPFVQTSIGSETAAAERVRRHRNNQKALQCNTDVTQVKQNGNVEIEIEKEIDIKDITVSKDTVCQTDVRRIVEAWNGLTAYGIKNISKLDCNSKRYQMLVSRVKQYSVDDILTAIENVKTSDFLQGKTKAAWVITFDWFVRPNNFPKVLEGNYNHGSTAPQQIDNDGWQ